MSDDQPVPDLVVLDVNETLSDLAPLRDAFVGAGLAAAEVDPWFAGVLRDGFALTVAGENPVFADVAADGLRARGLGDTEVQQVLAGFGSLPLHRDVEPGLRGLRGLGVRVVTLSNGAAAVAEQILTAAGVRHLVDEVLSVADAPAWKPHADAYAWALARYDVAPERALMVAVHPWDLDGAARAGLATAWIDRTGAAAYPRSLRGPDRVVGSLAALAGDLAADRAAAERRF